MRDAWVKVAAVLLLVCCASGITAAEMILHYKMDETAGTLIDQIGGESAEQAGSGHLYGLESLDGLGTAVGLDANGAWRLDVDESAELNNLINDFTVTAWIYLDSAIALSKSGSGSNYHRIIGDDEPWDKDAWSFGIVGDDLLFTKNAIVDARSAGASVPYDQWTHVAAVVSQTEGISFYINGHYDSTVFNTDDLYPGDEVFGIGRSYGGDLAQWFAGKLDEIQVHTDVLSEQTIADIAGILVPLQPVFPSDMSVNIPVDSEPTLEWAAGSDPEITAHVLYFSSDEDWVTNAMPTDSEAVVIDVNSQSYWHDKSLNSATTYYWRIDEIAGSLDDPDKLVTGTVWNFTTESVPAPPCIGYTLNGDIDGDCIVDLDDLLLLAQDWLFTSDNSKTDIDHSGRTDYADLSFIGRDWQTAVNSNDLNLMVISAHPDDEGIFGGGILPYYAQVKQIPVTLLGLVTRNPDGSDPLTSGSTSRVQELRNATDVYAGQEIGSGMDDLFGNYVSGNITLVPAGLIDTGCCSRTPDDSWYDDGDGCGWGSSYGVTEVTPGYGNMLEMIDGRAAVCRVIARQIRWFQPEVVAVVHDFEGDYGHSNHIASLIGLLEAYELAADPDVDIDGLAPWTPQKIYIRGGLWDNRDGIAYQGIVSDGGINPLFHDYMEEQSIDGYSPRNFADWALNEHASQGSPDVSTVFRSGERFDTHHSEWWTLYRSTVGTDTASTFTVDGDTTNSIYENWARGDFLENINY
ncbi:mycothiol conjugate amidase Mca [Anaerohalosphaera lusitana]|uniref:Mycothiol conjugate amidase Mca n=1 Tax=Anaerohalosphaera lusitana TaxID=1936003 RepID=A0A1U9NLY6_9BACT|nr:LamG-like jellyroll fold domain-containing protein [Anaerohalosphaera lusitana]AQT68748.1 mycothiol conjugate amidase Mca [Anaerohalosphaera lusitana]